MKNKPIPQDSDNRLREEVERLRQRLSELESSLGESRTTIAALQKNEHLYRAILENIPPVVYVVNVGNELLNSAIYSSPHVEKILGHTSEEFLNDPLLWVEMIYPEDRDHVMAESERADLTGGPFDAEYRVISSNNLISWFHDQSVLVNDEHGQPMYRVGILTDVTERKQAELALQQLDDMYRRAIDAAGAVPYILDEGMHSFLFIGEGIQQMTGYSASEMNSEIWDSLIQEGIPRGKLAHLTYEEADRAANEDHSLLWECDFRIHTRNGETRWIADTSVKGIDKKSGRLVAIGIKQDITERKQAEIALQRLEYIYRRAIDAAGAVPYVISHEGRWKYDYVGEGIYSLTGYSAEEMTAEIWDTLRLEAIPRGQLAKLSFEEADRLTNEDRTVLWECDFHIRTRDGQTRWIADTSVKRVDEKSGGLLSVGIYQDITERKLAEEVREKLIQELEQRNAELERLAYTLSHELKSPLITIRGFMGYLREDAIKGDITRLDRDLHHISEGTDKMLRLINELIDLMSVGRIIHNLTKFPLNELVNESLNQLHEKIVQKHVTVKVADDLPQVHGDRQRLLEVFLSLLDNSIKFMGEQSEPKIEIGMRQGDDANPVFYVSDNGIGIEPRFHERIFGIFHKLDAMSEGTGIGLALVRRIIDTHGGQIWVESEGLSKGTTFCFTISSCVESE